MKYLRLAILLFIIPGLTSAQKPVIDTNLYSPSIVHQDVKQSKWEIVENPMISNDGRYMKYNYTGKGQSKVIISSTDGKWKSAYRNVSFAGFSSSGEYAYLATLSGDSLLTVTLGTDQFKCQTQVRSFKIFCDHGRDLLTWTSPADRQKLFILEQAKAKQTILEHVVSITQQGDEVNVITQEKRNDGMTGFVFKWLHPFSNTVNAFDLNRQASDFHFSPDNSALVFKTKDSSSDQGTTSIWYFKKEMTHAEKILDGNKLSQDKRLRLMTFDGCHFSKDGESVFFRVEDVIPAPNSSEPIVRVWSYADDKMRTQLDKAPPHDFYFAMISLSDHRFHRLTWPNEPSGYTSFVNSEQHELALVDHRNGDADRTEWHWNENARGTEYLVEIKSGRRLPITTLAGFEKTQFMIDPFERFVLYFDAEKGQYFSYDIATKTRRDVTSSLKTKWEDNMEYPKNAGTLGGFSAWASTGRYVLLHDRFDLWLVDLSGVKRPVNVTNGYGKKHRIVFRLANGEGQGKISLGQQLLLSAFDKTNKDNGFYCIQLGKKKDPELLSMGPYFYEAPGHYPYIDGMEPIKAKDSNVYLVKRMSATDAPNYFSTTDFRTFTRLSDIQPAKNYNWYSTEVCHYKGLDGRPLDGLLYKPENFDPNKKYPVIFYYYEKLADRKNVYLAPSYSDGGLDIPTYVSQGYLVFTPDIHYIVGKAGQSAVNSIAGAAGFLSRRPYIDIKRMGLQGISFGGYETDFVITHSKLFAAACAASGKTDLVSNSGAIEAGSGTSIQWFQEVGQMRIGNSLGKDPDAYIRNSPIFFVKNVTTPLLMMHTSGDTGIPISDAIEFFTALRREGKRAWMLQYNHAVHALDDHEQAKDFTIRMQQFFDHYLKGQPAPDWMTGAN